MTDRFVYKALRPEEVAPSQAAGQSRAAVDAADGYVHLSTRAQIGETLSRHFGGLDGVHLYEIPTDALGAALKWEPSRGGDLFPHYYGDLSLDLASRHWVLPLTASGVPQLPEAF